jgi:hypothetical protein
MLFTILSTDFGDNVDAAKKPDFTRFSKRVAASYRILIGCLQMRVTALRLPDAVKQSEAAQCMSVASSQLLWKAGGRATLAPILTIPAMT